MNSPTEFHSLATQVLDLIAANEESFLKDHQNVICNGCSGSKFVYKSPAAYKVAQLLVVMKKRGYVNEHSRV